MRCRLLSPMGAVYVRQSVCHECTEWPPAAMRTWDSASLCRVIRWSLCQTTLATGYKYEMCSAAEQWKKLLTSRLRSLLGGCTTKTQLSFGSWDTSRDLLTKFKYSLALWPISNGVWINHMPNASTVSKFIKNSNDATLTSSTSVPVEHKHCFSVVDSQ